VLGRSAEALDQWTNLDSLLLDDYKASRREGTFGE